MTLEIRGPKEAASHYDPERSLTVHRGIKRDIVPSVAWHDPQEDCAPPFGLAILVTYDPFRTFGFE